jgi:LmbE family N-acetylglucosaminyl deacetylase
MNPYYELVNNIERLVREGREFPLGGFPLPARPAVDPDIPPLLIFSPHPDDECIIGGLAVRLQQEARVRVLNVAVTQGSNKARQGPRWEELRAACDYLGFELIQTVPGGLERINVKTRAQDPEYWQRSVDVVAEIIARHHPGVVLFPHDTDWNSTHVGTHHLVVDALARQPPSFTCTTIETEFWGAMASPNLMVELTPDQLAHMITALSFHVGEVRRNPYHLLLPAWMQDNVRRGSELVGGQGGAAPDFGFCTLYRLRRWDRGAFQAVYEGGQSVPASVSAARLIGR